MRIKITISTAFNEYSCFTWSKEKEETASDELKDLVDRFRKATRDESDEIAEQITSNYGEHQIDPEAGFRTIYIDYPDGEHEEALEAQRPRTIAGKFKSERRNASVPIETTRTMGHVLPTPISNTQISKRQPKNQQPERRSTIYAAIDACMSMGKRPQAQGFGGGQAPKEQQVGTDAQGRALKEVWVRGTKHLVVD